MRRVIMNKNKKNRLRTLLIYKYGAQVPRGVKKVIAIDEGNKNYLWQDEVKIEVTALAEMEFFELKLKNYKPSDDYQLKNLMIIFTLKQGLCFKARLVERGNLIDLLD